MPRPGSPRLTAQSNCTGRSSARRAVKPAPTQRVSADSMNIPFALMSRVFPRKTAEPHSISNSPRKEQRVAQRRSKCRGGFSANLIDLNEPPAKDLTLRLKIYRRLHEAPMPLLLLYARILEHAVVLSQT